MKPILLDTYCGAGGAAEGYKRAGFYVVGVDNRPQPRYRGDEFIQGDALEAILTCGREFDAIHASPPCQPFSALKVMPNARKHPELLTATRDLLVAAGKPWVIENVPGAPMRRDYVLCGSMFGLQTDAGDGQLRRHRWFETSFPPTLVPPCSHVNETIGCYGHGEDGYALRRRRRKTITVVGGHGSPGNSKSRQKGIRYDPFLIHERRQAMGIDWMTNAEITQAIPPAYTEFIGRQLMRHITGRTA